MAGRGSRGLTTVQLIGVILAAGAVAGILIPRIAASREQEYLTAMQTDLRNLAAAQQTALAQTQAYVADTAVNRGATRRAIAGWLPSPGVRVVTTAAGPAGWSAVATHDLTTTRCAIAVGLPAVPPARAKGEPGCE